MLPRGSDHGDRVGDESDAVLPGADGVAGERVVLYALALIN